MHVNKCTGVVRERRYQLPAEWRSARHLHCPSHASPGAALTTAFIDDTVMPKILTWTLGVQQEVYRNATIEVRYLGTRGLELPVQFRRNRISGFDGGLTALPEYFRAQDV